MMIGQRNGVWWLNLKLQSRGRTKLGPLGHRTRGSNSRFSRTRGFWISGNLRHKEETGTKIPRDEARLGGVTLL